MFETIVTKRMRITEAAAADVDRVIQLESHPDNRDYLWIGTREEHLDEIADPNHLLLVFRPRQGMMDASGTPDAADVPESAMAEGTVMAAEAPILGYALIRLDFKSNIFELCRIAIDVKGQGYGREAMEELLAYAFHQTQTNRFWLDVYPDNEIGIRLYESLGMHRDGVLRQNYKAERGYLDQIIYSLLRSEYTGK